MFRVIKEDKLINAFAKEIACQQCSADWWYYVQNDQDMSSFSLDKLVSLRNAAYQFGVLAQSNEAALKIYDFSNSGKDDFIPDLDFIQTMYDSFEDYRKQSLVF